MFENLEKEELIQIIENLKKENKDLKEQLHGKVEKEETEQEQKNIVSTAARFPGLFFVLEIKKSVMYKSRKQRSGLQQIDGISLNVPKLTERRYRLWISRKNQ